MTYTGEVSIDGPADTRELEDLEITKFAVGELANNVYLLRCKLTDKQILIDAAADAATITKHVGGRGLDAIVTTHNHRDHWGALAEVSQATNARTIAGELDVPDIPVAIDQPVVDGARVQFGACELEVIHIAGHTAGSIVLVYDDPDGVTHLFTGDSLFPGGVGKTHTPEQFEQLYGNVTTKLFDRFADDTWFYPGHGNDSTLGVERPALPQWQARGW